MAEVLGPTFWCHQCNRQTRPVIGPDFACTFCDGGFVEEMENTEIEPGIPFSSLPLSLANILGLPFSALNVLGRGPVSPAMDEVSGGNGAVAAAEHHGYRPRLIHGHHPEVSDLLGAMTDIVQQFPDHPMNVDDGNHDIIDIPSNRMLILRGDVPNFSGALANIEVFIDDGIGAQPQLLPGQFGDYFLGPEFDRLVQILAENDPNRYGTPPASKTAVDAMPRITISEEHMNNEVMQCAVCKDDFECGSEVRQMPCKHMYHGDCIFPWLSQHSTCPVCRFEMPTEPEDGLRTLEVLPESSFLNAGENVVVDEGNAASTNSGTGMAQDGNAQGRLARQFTLLGMPGIGMDLSSIVVDGQNNSRAHTAPTTSQSESSGLENTDIGFPVSIPWLFRLFSSFGASANSGDQADRTSSEATMADEQLQEAYSDVSGVRQEDLD